jgi:hypothetical protein
MDCNTGSVDLRTAAMMSRSRNGLLAACSESDKLSVQLLFLYAKAREMSGKLRTND